ncbi:type VII secretion-associated serine protease mycosin [Streptomyces sp. CMSTAAHL-2]|uniref:type VII secretion-associated serine protease mycosin n=1 Tax=Streptomyces sp. CMSTAAHL-2 TaxID=2904522 RepID=UPI001E3AED3E|nr:type VII secretion-associated serine protease mycosin [Streptomyces sp. CMSTAAHL-2]MCE3033688.1 type VII secretion-associated serine protease mycosin [Streptomyces sp. CMSTAAHL-2]
MAEGRWRSAAPVTTSGDVVKPGWLRALPARAVQKATHRLELFVLFLRRGTGRRCAPTALPVLRRFLVGVTLTGLWTITADPSAEAAGIRQAEWPLKQFQAEKAWGISQGQGVTVAVIDSGVDSAHPDLKGQILQGTGFIGDPRDNGQTDISDDSHGTAIAGIIAGTGKANAGNGMTGLAPKSKVLPVRVSTSAAADPITIAEGIKYAADHHAQVINISAGTTTPDPLLREAVTYALGKDAVIIASAGNDGENGNPAMYPAAFPGVIDVTGTDSSSHFWPVSESGPAATLAAPATDIYSANNRGQYVRAEGTSYAAGYVSAAAALVRSAFPHLSAGQTIRRLISTATRSGGSGHDDQYGYGLIDPLAALRAPAAVNGDTANPLLSANPLGKRTNTGTEGATLIAMGGAAVALLCASAWIVIRRRRNRSAKKTDPAQAPSRNTLRPAGTVDKKKRKSRT